jgi:hypothetical protein
LQLRRLESKSLLLELKNDSTIITESNLSNDQLILMVDHNQTVASVVTPTVGQSNQSIIEKFTNKEFTTQVFDVIHSIVISNKAPKKILDLFCETPCVDECGEDSEELE